MQYAEIRRTPERGQTLLIFVVSLAVLIAFLGLVIDGGQAFHARRILQNAADAAALAGTLVLMQNRLEPNYPASYQAAALSEARRAARANGAQDIAVSPVDAYGQPTRSGWSDPGLRGVSVRVQKPYDTVFIRAVGITKYDVRANATAVWGYTRSIRGMLPMAVNVDAVPNPWSPPPAEYKSTLSPAGGGAGVVNYGTFTVSGQSLSDAWLNGLVGVIRIGQPYPANDIRTITQETCNALQARIDKRPDETWTSFSPDSPRVAVMAVINGDVGGSTIVPINIVTLFIDAVDCNRQMVTLHFVRAPVPPSGTEIDPTLVNPPSYTPAIMKLVS
jgi:hypothetical protein